MSEKAKKRSEVAEKDTWRLEDIFLTDEAWEQAFLSLDEMSVELAGYRGTVVDSGERLAMCLDLDDLMSQRLMECLTYARMRKDQDNGNAGYQAMFERVNGMYFKIVEQTAFLSPEIVQADETVIRGWMNGLSGLKVYRHYLDKLLRQKPHILPEAQERLLAQTGPITEGVADAFSMLDNVDLKYGHMNDEKGDLVELTGGRFARFRESRDRSVRATAFEKIHGAYAGMGNTIAALFATQVKSDIFLSRTRNHATSLESALFGDRLETSVYSGLVDAVHDAMPSMHRYLALRKKHMELPELHIYDCYVSLADTPDREFAFDEACKAVSAGVAVFGPEYQDNLERMWNGRWIDRYENEGKTGGAYAWGTYGSHPFMLMNFSGGLMDVLTLAHEAGHCMHSLYSSGQPHVNAHYPIFLAEIASTVNEVLLIRSLMAECDESGTAGRREKAYLVNRLIEEFRLTVFRQTMFAEFEWITHTRAEAGEPLTAEALCGIYEELLRRYFGPDTVIDEYMRWEWARIPHFYNAFYVFKYATGFSAAVAFNQIMKDEGRPAVDRYLEFLRAGGSDYPLETLRKAGLDMADSAPIRSALAQFEELVGELESLLEST